MIRPTALSRARPCHQPGYGTRHAVLRFYDVNLTPFRGPSADVVQPTRWASCALGRPIFALPMMPGCSSIVSPSFCGNSIRQTLRRLCRCVRPRTGSVARRFRPLPPCALGGPEVSVSPENSSGFELASFVKQSYWEIRRLPSAQSDIHSGQSILPPSPGSTRSLLRFLINSSPMARFISTASLSSAMRRSCPPRFRVPRPQWTTCARTAV